MIQDADGPAELKPPIDCTDEEKAWHRNPTITADGAQELISQILQFAATQAAYRGTFKRRVKACQSAKRFFASEKFPWLLSVAAFNRIDEDAVRDKLGVLTS